MEWLNYHHLRYFWAVAREGTLRQAAEKMGVSQPSISAQIHLLEASLGAQLFRRSGRRLSLTDMGQLAFGYAEEIFSTGQDLLDAVRDRPGYRPMRCQVGVTDSVPKVVASRMLRPAFELTQPVHMLCREGPIDTLLLELAGYRLDLVLADAPAARGLHVKTFNHLLGTCGSVFCAVPKIADKLRRNFPRSLHGMPVLLPAETTPLRMALDEWFQSLKIRPVVVAEFEDPAFMMVMAAEGLGFVVAPSVIARETLQHYGLKSFGRTEACAHQYYAITAERRLKHPAAIAITDHSRATLFG
ncbi:MAG: LysR family transcriptional regulator [Lentisphaerae bacterium]|nr:LysR family transcriptional regulator [Lentisphaerota bacterium]